MLRELTPDEITELYRLEGSGNVVGARRRLHEMLCTHCTDNTACTTHRDAA